MSKNAPEFDVFLKAYPQYPSTKSIDALCKTENSRLDRDEHIYLDYTGGGIYAESQLKNHHELLSQNVYGDPH